MRTICKFFFTYTFLFCCIIYSGCANNQLNESVPLQETEPTFPIETESPVTFDENNCNQEEKDFESMSSEERRQDVLGRLKEESPNAVIFDDAEYCMENEDMTVFVVMYDDSSKDGWGATDLCFATSFGLYFLDITGGDLNFNYSKKELEIIYRDPEEPGVCVEVYNSKENKYYDYIVTHKMEWETIDSERIASPILDIDAEEKI